MVNYSLICSDITFFIFRYSYFFLYFQISRLKLDHTEDFMKIQLKHKDDILRLQSKHEGQMEGWYRFYIRKLYGQREIIHFIPLKDWHTFYTWNAGMFFLFITTLIFMYLIFMEKIMPFFLVSMVIVKKRQVFLTLVDVPSSVFWYQTCTRTVKEIEKKKNNLTKPEVLATLKLLLVLIKCV